MLKIIREIVRVTSLEINGFDMEKALAYLKMNIEEVSDTTQVEKFFQHESLTVEDHPQWQGSLRSGIHQLSGDITTKSILKKR